MEGQKLEIVLMEEAKDFLRSLPEKARKKVIYNILKVQEGEMDKDLFKKLESTDIWEFRTLFGSICYRLFSFWDTEKRALIIATHGIVKKTSKTPPKEIRKAEEKRRQYFDNKQK